MFFCLQLVVQTAWDGRVYRSAQLAEVQQHSEYKKGWPKHEKWEGCHIEPVYVVRLLELIWKSVVNDTYLHFH